MQCWIAGKSRRHRWVTQYEVCKWISRKNSKELVLPGGIKDKLRPHQRFGVAAAEFERVVSNITYDVINEGKNIIGCEELGSSVAERAETGNHHARVAC